MVVAKENKISVKRLSKYSDEIILQFIGSDPKRNNYKDLFKLFIVSFLHYAKKGYSLANYPGYKSENGLFQDSIEGFVRVLPLLAAWLNGENERSVHLFTSRIDIAEIIHDGIMNAVNKGSSSYYGDISNNDQRIIAASLIAISLWLSKRHFWANLDSSERKAIVTWLKKIDGKEVADNNWHLFIVLVNAVLKNLGEEYNKTEYAKHYKRHKSFYLGDGFYSDGPKGVVDYYNAWEVHPFLILLDQIDPEMDRSFIRETTGLFLSNFIYFFSPRGFPIYGRSICYRLALPTSLVLAEKYLWSPIPAGQTKRACDVVWTHFLKNGAVNGGIVTQGYYKKNYDYLDNYSGPASANWSFWSLAAMLSCPETSNLWTTTQQLLPVELRQYSVLMSSIGKIIKGNSNECEVQVVYVGNNCCSYVNPIRTSVIKRIISVFFNKYLESVFFKDKLPWRITHWFKRPDNTEIKYRQHTYSSKTPFCEN